MSHQFLVDLKEVFAKHGKPEPADHSGAMLHLLVLQLEAMEALLTTAAELQSKVSSLDSKLSVLEADTKALLAKGAGGVAPLVTQDQLDSMGTAVDGILTRMDTLSQSVVAGDGPTSAPTTPPAPVTPLAAATSAAAPVAAPATAAEAAAALAKVLADPNATSSEVAMAQAAVAAATTAAAGAGAGLGPATPKV